MSGKYQLIKAIPKSILGDVRNPSLYLKNGRLDGTLILNERLNPAVPGLIIVVSNLLYGTPREVFVPGDYFSPNINVWDVPPATSSVKVDASPSPGSKSAPVPTPAPVQTSIYQDAPNQTPKVDKGKPAYPIPEVADNTEIKKQLEAFNSKSLTDAATTVVDQLIGQQNATSKQDNSNLIGFGLLALFAFRVLR